VTIPFHIGARRAGARDNQIRDPTTSPGHSDPATRSPGAQRFGDPRPGGRRQNVPPERWSASAVTAHRSAPRRFPDPALYAGSLSSTFACDPLEEALEEGGSVRLVVASGVVALADEDGDELAAGLEVGASLAG
jgi:hypothetical protein